jgi:hypothetical protein
MLTTPFVPLLEKVLFYPPAPSERVDLIASSLSQLPIDAKQEARHSPSHSPCGHRRTLRLDETSSHCSLHWPLAGMDALEIYSIPTGEGKGLAMRDG